MRVCYKSLHSALWTFSFQIWPLKFPFRGPLHSICIVYALKDRCKHHPKIWCLRWGGVWVCQLCVYWVGVMSYGWVCQLCVNWVGVMCYVFVNVGVIIHLVVGIVEHMI